MQHRKIFNFTSYSILHSNGESNSSVSSFEIDVYASILEDQMLSTISEKGSIDNADFGEHFETN